MLKRLLAYILALMVFQYPMPRAHAVQPTKAFPEAYGFGAAATTICNRGNTQLLKVTNTNNSGAGSYRQAVSDFINKTTLGYSATDLSVMIFTTGGIATLTSNIEHNGKCLMIAGQSAPGGGFLLRSDISGTEVVNYFRSNAEHIAVRYLFLSEMKPNMSFWSNGNFIVDHVSSWWAINSGVTVTSSEDSWVQPPVDSVTVQHSIFAESLSDAAGNGHPIGMLISKEPRWQDIGNQHSIDLAYNLVISNDHRNPMMGGGGFVPLGNTSGTPRGNRMLYSVIYNWRAQGVQMNNDMGVLDFIRNYFKKGPGTLGAGYEFRPECGGNLANSSQHPQGVPADGNYVGHLWVYAEGNVGPHNSDPGANNFTGASRMWGCVGGPNLDGTEDPDTIYYDWGSSCWTPVTSCCPGANCKANVGTCATCKKVLNIRVTPMPAPTYDYPTDTAAGAYTKLVTNGDVGNYRRMGCDGTWETRRASIDTRLLNEAASGSGHTGTLGRTTVPNVPPESYPTLAAGTACTDTNGDGVPDAYITAKSLNAGTDYRNVDLDGDGWTVLEEYLSGDEPDDTPPPPPSPQIPYNPWGRGRVS